MEFFKTAKFKMSLVYALTVLIVCLFYWGATTLFLYLSLRNFAIPYSPQELPAIPCELPTTIDNEYNNEYNNQVNEDQIYYDDTSTNISPENNLELSNETEDSNNNTSSDSSYNHNVEDYSRENETDINQNDEADDYIDPMFYTDNFPNTEIIDPKQETTERFFEDLYYNYGKVLALLRTQLPIIMLIIAIVTAILSFSLGYGFSAFFLSPVNRLQKALDEVDLDTQIELKKIPTNNLQAEFKSLVDSYNKMLERVNQSYNDRKQFMQDASHELKTPLTIIQTNTELLEDSLKNIDSEDKESLVAIKKSIKRMTKLIKDMLLLEQIGQIHKREKVSISELIKHVVKDLEKVASKNGIKTTTHFHIKDIYILGNKELLERMIENIISNAIKYNRQKGTISIESYNDKERENQIVIEFKDSGIGMSQDEISNIWKRFYRIDKSRSRDQGGSGLGLSIVKEIAQLHSIEIDIKSNAGKGTNIFLSLTPQDL